MLKKAFLKLKASKGQRGTFTVRADFRVEKCTMKKDKFRLVRVLWLVFLNLWRLLKQHQDFFGLKVLFLFQFFFHFHHWRRPIFHPIFRQRLLSILFPLTLMKDYRRTIYMLKAHCSKQSWTATGRLLCSAFFSSMANVECFVVKVL